MIFDAPNGLRYDTSIHDFIESNGELASVERIAEAWDIPVEEVEKDRQTLASINEIRIAQKKGLVSMTGQFFNSTFYRVGKDLVSSDGVVIQRVIGVGVVIHVPGNNGITLTAHHKEHEEECLRYVALIRSAPLLISHLMEQRDGNQDDAAPQ